jgi:hemerythrin-like domain-containing protein
MHALASLTKEHALISRGLDALGAYAERLEKNPSMDARDLGRFARFFEDFAELWHHGKEEDVLLPALVRCGFAWDEGPVLRVREDHDQENYLARVLAQAAAQEASWTEEDRRHAIAAIRSFIEFERGHMEKEETVIYPAAAERLSAEAQSELGHRFAEIESQKFGSGSYERVLEDADALFKRYEPGEPGTA